MVILFETEFSELCPSSQIVITQYLKSLTFFFLSPSHSLVSDLGSVDKIINSLTQILDGVLQADQQMIEKTKAKVFSALITVLQMKAMKGKRQQLQRS